MGLFGSSGKSHKRQAEAYLRTANNIQDYQEEVEFRRQMLSNIRQERIARAQLAVRDYSPTYRSSTNEGFVANLESSLAGETDFSYGSSLRSQRITDLNVAAAEEYRKYAKKQKQRAMIGSVAGLVAGAVTGGLGWGTLGATVMGAQIGQGAGQILSNTGVNQTNAGIGNIMSGLSTGIDIYSAEKRRKELSDMYASFLGSTTNTNKSIYGNYLATSVIKGTPDYENSESFLLPQPDGTTVKACKGYF